MKPPDTREGRPGSAPPPTSTVLENSDHGSAKGENPEIATDLYLSPKTVCNHVSNILHKLQVADRTEAIIRAREAGLG